jgi:hypothetical protein
VTWLGDLPLPLLTNYVLVIDRQQHDVDKGRPSYVRGQWREHGWWYYCLCAAAFKVPLGLWLMESGAMYGRTVNAGTSDAKTLRANNG